MVTVRVRSTTNHVSVTVNDLHGRPGRNPDDEERDITMLALIERTELLGGTVRHTNGAGRGSTIQITLPLVSLSRSQDVDTDDDASVQDGGVSG